MRVGLIDVDGHHYPNLALMKISAWHKAKGDAVSWWWSDMEHFDVVYKSKVFSFTPDVPDPINADIVIRGGTGYAISLQDGVERYDVRLDTALRPEVERSFPNYSIYPELTADTAYGFLTRGCPRGCRFCHVGAKEGRVSHQVADLRDFWRDQREIVLMDANILACPQRDVILGQLSASGAYVDFNQGLDIRLVDNDVTDTLGKMRVKRLHFAWDNPADDLEPAFRRFAERYPRKDHRVKIVYVLTNFGSSQEEDLHRIYTLRRLGYDSYVMIYDKEHAPREARLLQRWCNNRIIFNTVPDFRDYDEKIG